MPLFLRLTALLPVFLLAGCLAGAVKPGVPTALPAHLEGQPTPAWSAPLHAAEVNAVTELDKRSLLLRTQRVFGTMQQWGLTNKDFVVVNIDSGTTSRQLTPAELQAYFVESYSLPSSLIIIGTAFETYQPRIVAIDRNSDEILWATTVDVKSTRTQQVLTADRKQIVQGNTDDDAGINLWALDTASGEKLWQRATKGPLNSEGYADYSLRQAGDSVILITDSISRVDPASGETRWSLRPGTLDSSKVQVSEVGNSLLLHDPSQLLAIDPKSGKMQWRYAASKGTIVAPTLMDGDLFVVERKGNVLTLSKLGSRTHRPAWSVSVADARSPLKLHKGRAYYTSGNRLVVMNLRDGRKLKQQTLPAELGNSDGLADTIAFHGSNIVVARENGVVAFDARTLRQRYVQPVYHGQGYNYDYLERKLALRNLARSGGGWDPGALTSAISQANVDMLYSMQTGYNEAQATSMGYNVSGSSMMLARSTALLGSTLSFSRNFRDQAVANSLAINKQQLAAAVHNQRTVIQHGYYLRPFYYKGWGVTVVRLSDGKRADFIHSVPIEPIRINQDLLPYFYIDPDNKRLIVKGYGLHPDLNDGYEKVGFGYDVYKSWPGIPDNWTLPNASLLAYDLDKLTFRNESPYRSEANRARASENELELRKAIMNNEVEKVRGLLQRGVDVNAVDNYGLDALIYAAIMDNKEIVELLIANGADATFRDPHGWMAYHYTFMTHAMNRSTGEIRDANLKQTAK